MIPVVMAGTLLGGLVPIVVALIVVGVILWLINAYVPMDATIKKILNVVVLLVVVLWVLKQFGLI